MAELPPQNLEDLRDEDLADSKQRKSEKLLAIRNESSRSLAPASDRSCLEPSPLTPVGITMLGTLQEDCNGGQLRREKKGSEHAGIYGTGGGRIRKSDPNESRKRDSANDGASGIYCTQPSNPNRKGCGEWYL
jgi:hypothetical protein